MTITPHRPRSVLGAPHSERTTVGPCPGLGPSKLGILIDVVTDALNSDDVLRKFRDDVQRTEKETTNPPKTQHENKNK